MIPLSGFFSLKRFSSKQAVRILLECTIGLIIQIQLIIFQIHNTGFPGVDPPTDENGKMFAKSCMKVKEIVPKRIP